MQQLLNHMLALGFVRNRKITALAELHDFRMRQAIKSSARERLHFRRLSREVALIEKSTTSTERPDPAPRLGDKVLQTHTFVEMVEVIDFAIHCRSMGSSEFTQHRFFRCFNQFAVSGLPMRCGRAFPPLQITLAKGLVGPVAADHLQVGVPTPHHRPPRYVSIVASLSGN